MDMMTIIGLVAVMATVLYVLAAGNIMHMLLNPLAMVVVFGGTISATLIAYPWDVLKSVLPSMRVLFFPSKNTDRDRQDLIEILTGLAGKAKREGVEGLQEDVRAVENAFLAHGLQMVVDGLERDVIRDNLEREIFYTRQGHQKIAGAFRTMATVSPIFGLLGTLLGVVEMLRNLSNPAQMGAAMGNAVIATFYGIFTSNICIPIATKLNDHSDRDIVTKEMALEGILSIHQGDVPLIVRKKLNAFASVLPHIPGRKEARKP